MVGELNLQDYGVTADELKDLASKARASNTEEQVNAIRALVQALRDANDRISIEGMRYLYFLTQHVLDQELPASLREEVASLIKRYMGSRLNFATTPVESLIIESYRTKLAIKESHEKFDGKSRCDNRKESERNFNACFPRRTKYFPRGKRLR